MASPEIALLTGGGDRPYVVGLSRAMVAEGYTLDVIGSDFLDVPELRSQAQVRFLNLRGDTNNQAPLRAKLTRISKYYARLLAYAAGAEPRVFHILWNNKFEILDRTALLLYYRLLGKRLVMTVHNVNTAERDGTDSALNRLTLRIQYGLMDHLFTHTEQMKQQLQHDYGVPASKISVFPFPVNSTVPDTAMTAAEARQRLGLRRSDKVLLFFGNIAPYKGLEYLIDAVRAAADTHPDVRLVIAGRPKGPESYWADMQQRLASPQLAFRTLQRIEFVPDEDTEIYFKAADALVLPYAQVFQSGVLFLAYNFGLPVLATNIASFKADVIEGMTGFLCPPRDAGALAASIERFFASDLYAQRETRRDAIRRLAHERYSWGTAAAITSQAYRGLLPAPAAQMAPRLPS
jgi:glycosyltransferase involved in cell wall biosynthesis